MEYQRTTKSAQKEQSKIPSSSLRQTSLNHVAVHPLLELQRTIGNQAVLNMLRSQKMQIDTTTQALIEPRFGHDFSQIPLHSTQAAVPQTKLKVNQPGDVYEQEADQVAEQVMRMTDSEPPIPDNGDQVKTSLMREQSTEPRADTATDIPGVPPIVHGVLNSSGGQPLDAKTRAFMEPRFGHDFSRVRVHTDERAAESTRAVNALAYTVGRDVVFGKGQYAPGTSEGQRLLAHELAHTVQQDDFNATPPMELKIESPDSGLETEARRIPQNIIGEPDRIEQGGHRTALLSRADPGSYLYRQTPPGGSMGGTPRRSVYIDHNVIDQINRGNQVAASSLKQMIRSGVEVRVSPYGYEELVNKPEIPRTAVAQRLMLEELGIRTGPTPRLEQRVDVVLAGQTRSGASFVSIEDAQLIAAAKAGGGEIWSFDRVIRNDPQSIEKAFGVKVAPETKLPLAPQGSRADYRVGRELMGLEPVHISLTGTVTRGGPPPLGGGPTSPSSPTGGSPPASPVSGGAAGARPQASSGPAEDVIGGVPVPKIPSTESAVKPPILSEGEGVPPKVSTPQPSVTPKVPSETTAEVTPGVSGSRVGTALGAFQIALLLVQFLPDPIEQQAIQQGLVERLNDPKSRARFAELEPLVHQSSGVVYYTVKFKILYSVYQHWHWRATPIYTVKSIEVLEINISKDKIEDGGKLDPPSRPKGLELSRGGAYGWEANRICTISILPVRSEIGPTYGLMGDAQIRDAINTADAATIARIPTAEKIRIINRLFNGWVSDADISAIKKIYQNTPSSQQPDIKQAIERRIPDMTSIRQRTLVRVILTGG